MAFFRYSVLAFRVLIWVLLASFIFFALASALGVVHERERARQAAHEDARRSVERALPTVSVALWQYDTSGLDALVRGMVQAEALIRIEIGDHRGIIAEAGIPATDAAQARDREWRLPVVAPEGGAEIGYIHVDESHAAVDRRLAGSASTLMLSELAKFGGLAVILMVIVYRQVARHLHDLAEHVGRIDPAQPQAQVGLQRRKLRRYRDELDILVEAINRFLAERAVETQRRTVAEDALRQRVSEVETILAALSDGVVALDAEARVLFANTAACHLLGHVDAITGQPRLVDLLTLANAADGQDLGHLLEAAISQHREINCRGDVLVRPVQAPSFEARVSIVPVPDPGAVAAILVFTDVSAEMAQARRIAYEAFHDPLTRLGNRSLLARDLAQDIAATGDSGQQVAVLCLDLDNFKNINDALGHAVGDTLLRQLAERLRAVVQPPGWVTRHGGDEFIIVLPGAQAEELAARLADRLMHEIAQPFLIDGHQLRVTSSVGISLAPEHGTDIGLLLSCADLAMYAAKHAGKNAWRLYEAGLRQRSEARLALENGLRVAQLENRFSLVFQPKVTLAGGRIDAVEALLRWRCADGTWVPPASFIPIAEETGLINDIGAWVLHEACRGAQRIRQAIGRDLAVAVNVSPTQFRGDMLMRTLTTLSSDYPDLRGLIEIELTESALAGDFAEAVAKLQAMRDLGLSVAIDDFGTGYSSLAYLRDLPVDMIKIDQSFVRGLPESAQDQALVAAIVGLGRSFGFRTVAEGVETAAHAEWVRQLGCEYAQGYWYARPLPESELIALLQQGESGHS